MHKPQSRRIFADGTTFFEYTHIVKPSLKHSYITISHDKGVVVKTPFASVKHLRQLLQERSGWISTKLSALKEQRESFKPLSVTEIEVLRLKAQSVIPAMVEEWSQKMGLFPTAVKVRRAKRRWGSCSGRDSLNFNIALMRLPDELVEYVVVHELAHIAHKNHSRAFWELVFATLPDGKARDRALKNYSPTL